MKISNKNIFTSLKKNIRNISSSQGKTFIKADKQLYSLLGILFAISAVAIIGYWFLVEKPYYEKLLTDKDEVIKRLKFMSMKQKKIYENTLENAEKTYKEKLEKNVMQTELLADYEQKLDKFRKNYISKDDHEKQMAGLEQRLNEEQEAFGELAKKSSEMRISRLEQKISLLQDENLHFKDKITNQRRILDRSLAFIEEEKKVLETMISFERKKAFIPSLILPETKHMVLNAEALKKLVVMKDKLAAIERLQVKIHSDAYFEMGLVSYHNKQFEEAIEYWENAVSLNKNNFQAYLCLGIVYNQEGMTENATKILERAIEINPKHAILHLTLARIYEQENALDEAIYEYAITLEMLPDNVDIYNTLGILYEQKGMTEEARKSFATYEKLKGGVQ